MTKEFESFNCLFQKDPNIAIFNINNDCDEIKQELKNIVNTIGGSFKNKEFDDIELNRFRLTAREFEYAVICDCLDKVEDVDRFIKEIYKSLENSAQIIVLSKKDKQDIKIIENILDKNDFRAVNSIDIFEKYNLVMAKKMHMWGNGL